MTPKIKGFTMGSIAAASYGLNPLFALPLYREGLSVDSVLFFRYAFAILMMAILLRHQRVDMRVRRREWPLLALYGLLFSASSLFLFLSYNYMDAGIASTILFMYPVMVAVIMALCFGERASALTWLCILLAVGGVSLLTKTSDGSSVSLLGITFVLLSSLSYAIYIVGVNRSSIARMPSPKLTFYALCFGILIYIVRTRGLTELQLPHTLLGWTCAFCLALFPTIISLIAMTVSIRNIGSTSAAILGALEPITALLVGTLVFGERLTPRLCLGIFLVLLAVTLLIAGKKIYYTLKAVVRKNTLCLLPLLLLATTGIHAASRGADGKKGVPCPMVRLEAERLPDLNVPRGGHQTLVVGDEIMVAGGHTDGFVPTATAEFLRLGDREWRLQPTIYIHDMGTSVQLRSGEVLLMGGAAEPLGIGQTFSVERYRPASHTFQGFGCLDTKRMYASAEQLADGQMLVTGNWFHRDAMEVFDGEKFFTKAQSVGHARACPYIFPTADGDALILGTIDSIGGVLDNTSEVERLHGAPIDVPLLRDWQPIRLIYPHPATASALGNEGWEAYDYLTVLENHASDMRIGLIETSGGGNSSSEHPSGQPAAGMRVTLLSELPPLPKTGPEGQDICFFSAVLVDRVARRGYVVGHDNLLNLPLASPNNGRDSVARHYVFAFDYVIEHGKSNISLRCQSPVLYYTDPLPGVGMTTPVLLPSGDLALVAGVASDNFAPFSAAYLLPLGRRDSDATVASAWHRLFPWGAGILLLLLGLVMVVAWRRHLVSDNTEYSEGADYLDSSAYSDLSERTDTLSASLLPRIRQLMEDKQLYLREDLKVQDLATLLDVSRRMVSETIASSSEYASFAQFVNAYRVEHAKQLMRQHPEKKMTAIGLESGFANETSFFRTFKSFVGMTPKECVQRTS
ncbi:MAG: EamA family transporter [Bacteroidaceae bacterium]|nr:EamA family transporter [Bacteroidaceae bacterium]